MSGQLLIYYVQRYPDIEKTKVFEWLRELTEQLESYHKCKNDQPYRYLNPYSVLVTKEETLVLLDMEAQSNEFVLRNMQKQAMRSHFIKPIVHIKENTRQTLDLYAYGKTVQFLLANINIHPALTKREEYRLSKIVGKCLGESSQRRFDEWSQVRKELPVVRAWGGRLWKNRIAYIALSACLLATTAVSVFRMGEAEHKGESVQEQLGIQVGENQKLEESNRQLSEENRQLLEENQTLKAENQVFQEENDRLQEETKGLKQEIQSLQEENQELQQEDRTNQTDQMDQTEQEN